MPNQDGTGPQGIGPSTGRGCGPCQTTAKPCPKNTPGRRRFWNRSEQTTNNQQKSSEIN